ncbi:MAG: LysM peptidoglycan-binding domain-containing protein [Gemmatimonadetes bacterium]|nr:LysM peptidoglycan-binding domain-containing protein [Gemmatimonadota bacterium]
MIGFASIRWVAARRARGLLPASGTVMGVMFLSACAGGSSAPVASHPQFGAVPRTEESQFPVVQTIAVSDSAADEAALVALRELEFTSLAKGADHLRGTLPAADPATDYPEEWTTTGGSGGGTAAASLDIESFADHRRVRYYVDYFLGPSRNRFNIWLGRLGRYEGMITAALQRYGLPQELLYLALIESGYSNTAVSRSYAVGMWQFVRSTGRGYDLRITSWVDERRDPFKATDAAARHLVDLQEEFGAWYLAAAAYNAGAGSVSRGIQRLPDQDVSDEMFFALSDRRYLRRETRDYVPKLIAATMVAQDPERYGFRNIPLLEPLVFDEITVPDQTGLDVIAQLADTTVRAINELNPQYFRGATPPREEAIVRVPRGTGTMVARLYEELPASERVNFLDHVVRRGETLGEIARRYRVSLGALQAANPRVQPRRMYVGTRLVIPVGRAARTGRRTRIARASVPPSGYHTVRRGDTLWIISQRYGLQVSDLRDWNGMGANESLLQVGQRLRVRQ